MSRPAPPAPASPATRRPSQLRPAAGPLSFARLKWTSFGHSCVYLGLLASAFLAGKPEPLTFILGLAHGLLWIFMSLACIAAARLRVVSLRLAVAVAVLGGIGPFFGSYEFVREQRQRAPRAIEL
ncbi:MAG TPA: hypothetical protein VES97_07190 [Solirubrobacteraceae bacterium]|nr:hypothetical protein [Solirubrobacteraceae bacterium]